MAGFLTTARRSVLEAIDAWPATADTFKKKWVFDDETAVWPEIDPALADLPALSVFPMTTVPAWWTQQHQQYPYPLEFHVWTPDWKLPRAEELWEHIVDAVFQAVPEGETVTYVKAATGFYPWKVGPLTMQRVKLGEAQAVKAIHTVFSIVLRLQFNPFTNTPA